MPVKVLSAEKLKIPRKPKSESQGQKRSLDKRSLEDDETEPKDAKRRRLDGPQLQTDGGHRPESQTDGVVVVDDGESGAIVIDD